MRVVYANSGIPFVSCELRIDPFPGAKSIEVQPSEASNSHETPASEAFKHSQHVGGRCYRMKGMAVATLPALQHHWSLA